MQYSENLDLLEPDQNEQYNINHFNRNSEILDEHIHNLETGAESLRADMEAGDAASRKFSNMEGVCQIAQGGTGKTTAQDAINALHGDVQAEGMLSDVDEFLFLRRTHEDVAQGIPESLDTKSVLLDELAQKIFSLVSGNQGGVSSGIFTPTANGFAPKSGNAGGTKFLNALGQWAEPQGKTEIVSVTASQDVFVTMPTVIRILSTATVLVHDASVYGVNLTITNETPVAQLLSIRFAEGTVSYKINKNGLMRLFWNGSFWQYLYDEPQCGDIKETWRTTAPLGWFICDGRDTTGQADELATRYPNLYALLGSNVLPDLRECTLVGAGRNTLNDILNHDVYAIGEFRDDQMRNHNHNSNPHNHGMGHTHTRGTMEILGSLTDFVGITEAYGNNPTRASGAFSTERAGLAISGAMSGLNDYLHAHHLNFKASSAWSGETSNASNEYTAPATVETHGANGYRLGDCTHGKQKGINFMIKA